jgi:hypothetical protein
LAYLNELKGFMPPFIGTEAERKALDAWLLSLNPPPTSSKIDHGPSAMKGQSPGATGEGGSQQ